MQNLDNFEFNVVYCLGESRFLDGKFPFLISCSYFLVLFLVLLGKLTLFPFLWNMNLFCFSGSV